MVGIPYIYSDIIENSKPMLLKMNPQNPSQKQIGRIVETLKNGELIIYPTDTVYSVGCDMSNKQAIRRLAEVVGKPTNRNLSLVVNDFAQISDYTLPYDRSVFKTMKKNLPGPFTFILNANDQVPKIFDENKKEIGFRMPDSPIAQHVIQQLGNPLVSASIHDEDEIVQYPTEPETIHERFKKDAAVVIDGGNGDNNASTVLSCLNGEMKVLREGKGDVALLS